MNQTTRDLQNFLSERKETPLPRGRFVIDDSLVLYRSMSYALRGAGGANFSRSPGLNPHRCGTILEWRGPSDKPVLELSNCLGLIMEGINVEVPTNQQASACVRVKHGGGSLGFDIRSCGFVGGDVGIQWGISHGEATCANANLTRVHFEDQAVACYQLVNAQSLEHTLIGCDFARSPRAIDVRAGGDVTVIGGGTYEVGSLLNIGRAGSNTRGFDISSIRLDGLRTRTAFLTVDDTDRAQTYGCVSFRNVTQNNGQRESDLPLLTIPPGMRVKVTDCGLGGSLHDWCRMYSTSRVASELYVTHTEGFETTPEKLKSYVTCKGPKCRYRFSEVGNLFVETGSYDSAEGV